MRVNSGRQRETARLVLTETNISYPRQAGIGAGLPTFPTVLRAGAALESATSSPAGDLFSPRPAAWHASTVENLKKVYSYQD